MATTKPKAHALILTAEQVAAFLNGKTQHRVVIDPQPTATGMGRNRHYNWKHHGFSTWAWMLETLLEECSYRVGDAIWGKEKFTVVDSNDHELCVCYEDNERWWISTAKVEMEMWSQRFGVDYSARFMPSYFSRTTRVIASVQVERLQDISQNDAKAEGINPVYYDTSAEYLRGAGGFQYNWDSTHPNPDHQWAANPWVIKLTLKKAEAP